MSRSTVRNALNELEELGIVERRPPVGTFVTGEALKRIEQLTAQPPRLRALFVMTTGQIDNPFLQRLFLALKNPHAGGRGADGPAERQLLRHL